MERRHKSKIDLISPNMECFRKMRIKRSQKKMERKKIEIMLSIKKWKGGSPPNCFKEKRTH